MVFSRFIGGTTGMSWLLMVVILPGVLPLFGNEWFVIHEISGSTGAGSGGLDAGGELLMVFGEGAAVALDLNAVPELRRLTEEGCSRCRRDRGSPRRPCRRA